MKRIGVVPAVLVLVTLATATGSEAGQKKPIIFEPVPKPDTRSYFANGEPFAIVTTDSAIVMLVLDPAELTAYRRYLRLWCLYYSTSTQPVLLDPSSMAKLVSTKIKKNETEELVPESPSVILKAITSEAASKEILQVIGGVLAGAGKAMSVQSTTITGRGAASGSSWTMNDQQEKQRAVTDEAGRRTAAAVQETETAYDLYSRSVNSGILRRNTVFPGGSVNGYIYFPAGKNYAGKFAEYQHVLALQLPHGTVSVEFNPAEGE